MNATQFLIHQELRAYTSQIQSWAQRVCAQYQLDQMARLASHPPSPGPMVRGLSALTGPEARRANSMVERALLYRVRHTTDPAELARARPLLCGHFPQVVRALDAHRATLA